MADTSTGQRRGVYWIGLLFSLVFLSVATAGFRGDAWWLFSDAAKWAVAGVVAAIGVGLLLTALPGRGRRGSG